MKHPIVLFIGFSLFVCLILFGCLSIDPKNCDNMNDGEVHDECYINFAVSEYLKTNDTSTGLICKNKMDLDQSSILCYESLAVASAYHKNNFHAVSFCEDLYEMSNDRNYTLKYYYMIDCLTEVAVIIGDESICEHAENRFEADNSFWVKVLAPSGPITNMKKDICVKRAILSRKRLANLPIEIFK